ncbi:hypothetical protein GN958_ATG02871 [Phytophthora infestans]|uniref:Uncharacterized protein n=1 Tax=Phytophthora infestans TaxID=4787 RepID=A0A8S9V9N1_PHYIN|nr:hypothetical protein GN958_ATG02871 [Phytophthora infestans]
METSEGLCDASAPSDLHTATLEAFYSRVIQRVCSSYREKSELVSDEDIERLRQKWLEKLSLYTGKHSQSASITENCDNEVSAVESIESSTHSDFEDCADEEDRLSIPSSSSSSSSQSSPLSSPRPSFIGSEAASEQVMGRPSGQLPSAATSTASSIFSKMLGAKRKLHQLDGSVSDDDDAVEWQDDDVQELQTLETQTAPLAALMSETLVEEDHADSDTEDGMAQAIEEEKEQELSPIPSSATSLLASAQDFSPVSGLSGINLPLQLAAQYSKFMHRGKRRGYLGQLHAIVLTWPSSVGASGSVLPGDMVWCCPDSERGFLEEGELVKVVALGDALHELKIEHSNGTEATVQWSRVRRLKEFLIRKGTVRFRSEQ